MDIQEKHKNPFKLIGLRVRTTNINESSPDTALIPGLWQQFFSENVESQIPNKTDESFIFGVYSDYDDDTEKSYNLTVGREVYSLQNLPKELVGIEVPESDYLVFSEEGEMPAIIYSLWESIRVYFSGNKKYQRQFSYDFECYSTGNSSRLEIYISIRI